MKTITLLSALLLTGCSHTPDSCLTGEHYGNIVHPGEILLLPLYVAGCYATADWADPDNLATVAPVADDETSAMDRYYEGLLKDKRDRARATVDYNERPEDSWCNSGLEDCEK